jgi:hypothetical protein
MLVVIDYMTEAMAGSVGMKQMGLMVVGSLTADPGCCLGRDVPLVPLASGEVTVVVVVVVVLPPGVG